MLRVLHINMYLIIQWQTVPCGLRCFAVHSCTSSGYRRRKLDFDKEYKAAGTTSTANQEGEKDFSHTCLPWIKSF